MSLFPAYDDDDDDEPPISMLDEFDVPWLENSSFHTGIIPRYYPSTSRRTTIRIPSSDSSSGSSCEEVALFRKRIGEQRARTPTRAEKPKVMYALDVKNVYYEQRKRDIVNCSLGTLPARVRPEYIYIPRSLGFVPFELVPMKKDIVPRYHAWGLDASETSQKPESLIKSGTPRTTDGLETNFLSLFDCSPNIEEEQKSLTRKFNEKLTESPHDIDLWLRYVKFQDICHRFERSQSRENKAAICQKKLSIVEKGLERNPDSKDLLREKLNLMSELCPADQFSNQIENLVNKDPGNIYLWQALIMATQSSIAMCTVPRIMGIYNKCFGTLRLWSRTSSRDHDERLLEMLFQCFVFLRQAGLWEQMWETLRLNLSLNLGLSKDALQFQRSIDEKKLIELEEVILTSGLPLNHLWLRVESLRESCHWIGVDRDQLEVIGDSHRFVSPEDVTDFVHPMLTRDSNLRLAIYALVTLKVPILPTSDSILKDLGLDKCGWTIDSIESILPMLYPTVGVVAGFKQRKFLWKDLSAAGLTSGPQYLQYHPAQEPYLDFIRDTFRVIAESLSFLERTCLYVWWLRFERMLVCLCKGEPKSENRRKKLKGILKNFLKKAENRSNLHFYREYALIEREMGRYDNCVAILETAIDSASATNEDERTSLLSLRRTLIETLLDVRCYNKGKKARVNRVLCQFIPDDTERNDIELVEAHLRESLENFLAQSPWNQTESIDAYFLPNPICDIVACYAYLLYANDRNISEILSVFDACLKHTSGSKYMQERFYENEIVILQVMNERYHGMYSILVERLNTALSDYPDNFYLLSVFAGIESELPNWKLNKQKEKYRPWQALAFCLGGRARIHSFMRRSNIDAARAAINKLINFHRRLARASESRHCPLTWRLLMLLLREQNLSRERGEDAYHESVAQCPWARSIYIDAAEVAPQVLTQIQDVIREKDLRMHVTPEELDILRG